jgi:hypothetical protein
MSRKKRMKDIREAKDRRAKKLAVGAAVLLAVVLAFEMPKVLKHGGSSSSTAPAATTTAATSAPTAPATTAPGTAAAAAPPTAASTKLTDSDRTPRVSKSQLFAFSHFAGKDPFVQQVSASTSGSSSSGTSGSAASAAAAAGVITAGSGSTTAATTSASLGQGASPARTLAKTGAVTISVNGTVQTVRVGGSFPGSNPLFKLVSVARGVVRIGIANGSYASGTQTVVLTAGRTLTLVDTSDGAHYKLRLVSGA